MSCSYVFLRKNNPQQEKIGFSEWYLSITHEYGSKPKNPLVFESIHTHRYWSCENRHKSEYTPTIIYIKYIQIKRGVINQIDCILLFMTIIKI